MFNESVLAALLPLISASDTEQTLAEKAGILSSQLDVLKTVLNKPAPHVESTAQIVSLPTGETKKVVDGAETILTAAPVIEPMIGE